MELFTHRIDAAFTTYHMEPLILPEGRQLETRGKEDVVREYLKGLIAYIRRILMESPEFPRVKRRTYFKVGRVIPRQILMSMQPQDWTYYGPVGFVVRGEIEALR